MCVYNSDATLHKLADVASVKINDIIIAVGRTLRSDSLFHVTDHSGR